MENIWSGARRMCESLIKIDLILEWAGTNGITISHKQLEQLKNYQERVLEINKYMNLTTITHSIDFAIKHIIDSLTVLHLLPDKHSCTLVDVGTGAGFPGMIIGIMRPDLQITLMDSLRKRIFFLQETTTILGLTNITCVHARAEEYKKGKFDICTARAVAKLDKLINYALPLLEPNGIFLAMKGPDVTQEIEDAKIALKKHNAVINRVEKFEIAQGLVHSIVVIHSCDDNGRIFA